LWNKSTCHSASMSSLPSGCYLLATLQQPLIEIPKPLVNSQPATIP
jgi:hypothetical protein